MLRRLVRDPVVLAAFIGLLCVCVHLPVLSNGFVLDDEPAIYDNPLVNGDASFGAVFKTNFWGDRKGYDRIVTWRPLVTLSFRGIYAAFGPNPVAFHAASVIMHGLVCGLVFGFLYAWLRRRGVAIFGAALFAVLPVHVEAVAGAVSLAELMAAAAYLGGMIAFLRSRYALAVTLFAAGLLCKEHVITWPVSVAVLWLHGWLRHRQNPQRSPRPAVPPTLFMVAGLAVVCAWFGVRARILPSVLGGEIPLSDNPMVGQGVAVRILTGCKLYFLNLQSLVAPLHLSADYTYNAVPLATSITDADAFAGLCLALLSLGGIVWGLVRRPDIGVALLLFAVLYGLISNVFILSTILMADRVLYLPSVAFVALVGLMYDRVYAAATSPAVSRVLIGAFVVICAGYAVRTVDRCGDWRDASTLFGSSLNGFPGSQRAHYLLGYEYARLGRRDQARRHVSKAKLLAPGDVDALTILSSIDFEQGYGERALENARAAFKRAPKRQQTATNLCRALVVTDHIDEAIRVCAGGGDLHASNPMFLVYLGQAYLHAGRQHDARTAFEGALRRDPDNVEIQAALERLQ